MLTGILLVRLLLAFAVGSIWVASVTVLTERKGTAWGILGGFPSTAAFSLLFIGVNQSVEAAVEATIVLPIVFSVSNAFLLLYAFFARRGFGFGFVVSLLAWLGFSAAIAVLELRDYTVSLLTATAASALTFTAFLKIDLPYFEYTTKLYDKKEVLLRGVAAGTLVSSAVLLSQVGGPIIGGIAASFPAVYASTIVILYRSRSTEFSRAMTKPLAISGVLLVTPYSVAVHYIYPVAGIWMGTLLSYLAVTPLAFVAYLLAKRTCRGK